MSDVQNLETDPAIKVVANTNARNNQSLAAAIHDAQILVAYAAERGSSVEEDVIRVIVSSGSLYAQQLMNDDAETAFWLAYNTLAKAVAPVTVISLQAVLDPPRNEKRRQWSWAFPPSSLARRAVRWYTILAIVTLCSLLVMQIYWLFGKQITSDIRVITDKHTESKAKWEAARRQAQSLLAKNSNANKKVASTANQEVDTQETENSAISSGNVVQDVSLLTLKAQEQTYLLHKKSSYESLHVWSRIWAMFLPNPQIEVDDPGEKRIYDNSILLQSSNLLLDALQRYLLPLLYGLLGTCVYVLRTLSSEILARTYSEASNIGFRIRLYLGTLGGMVFAWFIIPEQSEGMFKSLSPFALAFLAGYSVEILFAAMDRFLVAFTNK
jgi:hypothetical protein